MLRPSQHFLRYCALPLALAFAWTTMAWSCPNCKDALAHDPAQAGLVRGFFWSIMFMVSMPFLIFGGISAYFYWEVRRARQAKQMGLADQHVQFEKPSGSPFAERNVRVEEPDPVGVI